jgi:hypothetical protein
MGLSDGYFWSRRLGGYNFYAGRQGLAAVDFDHPVAACGPAAEAITLRNIFQAECDHWLAVRTVSRFGLESTDQAWLRVRTDEVPDGKEVPDAIRNLRAGLAADGGVKLEWEYEPRLAMVRPSEFKVYVGSVDGPIDWSQPIGTVSYRENQRLYVWEDSEHTVSEQSKVAVRAEAIDGVDDGSTESIIARPDVRQPGVVEDAWIEMI